MTSQAPGASAPIEAAHAAVTQAFNLTSLAAGSFSQIAALFRAIAKQVPEHSDASNLAALGDYLCADWGNLHDCEHEELTALFERLTTLKKECRHGQDGL